MSQTACMLSQTKLTNYSLGQKKEAYSVNTPHQTEIQIADYTRCLSKITSNEFDKYILHRLSQPLPCSMFIVWPLSRTVPPLCRDMSVRLFWGRVPINREAV